MRNIQLLEKLSNVVNVDGSTEQNIFRRQGTPLATSSQPSAWPNSFESVVVKKNWCFLEHFEHRRSSIALNNKQLEVAENFNWSPALTRNLENCETRSPLNSITNFCCFPFTLVKFIFQTTMNSLTDVDISTNLSETDPIFFISSLRFTTS